MKWRIVVTFDTTQKVTGRWYYPDNPKSDDPNIDETQKTFLALDKISSLAVDTLTGAVFIPKEMVCRSFITIEVFEED